MKSPAGKRSPTIPAPGFTLSDDVFSSGHPFKPPYGRADPSFTISIRRRDDLSPRGDETCCPLRSRAPVHPIGGARRDRTDDLMLAKHALYQLSYGPMPTLRSTGKSQGAGRSATPSGLVGPGRLELPTLRLSGVRSNHLSYGPSAARRPRCTLGARDRSPHNLVQAERRSGGKRNGDGGIPPVFSLSDDRIGP
jgi:hypothetical protein